jgi:hypothetical protein
MRLAVVAAKLMVIAATFVHSRQMRHPHAQCSHFGFHQCRGLRTNSRPARRCAAPKAFTTIDRRCGTKVSSGQLRSGPSNRALVVPTDRNVSIDTILLSTRFPASGEIARILIIAVSAMYPTKLLVANEHSSS